MTNNKSSAYFAILIIFIIVILVFIVVKINHSDNNWYKFNKKPTIGIVMWDNTSSYQDAIKGFIDGLVESGFKENTDVYLIIENALSSIKNEEYIINKFIKQKVDLIYTMTTSGTKHAKKMTSKIPIVFSMLSYPIETGLIKTIENSNNNLVGIRNYIPVHKQYYPFIQIFGEINNIGFVKQENDHDSEIQLNNFKILISNQTTNIIDFSSKNIDSLKKILNDKGNRVDAFFAACDPFMQTTGTKQLINYAKSKDKPVFTCDYEGINNGALMGNVIRPNDIGKLSGVNSALILNGAKPSWIKTQTPKNNKIILNKKTADELKITINEANKIIIDRFIYE